MIKKLWSHHTSSCSQPIKSSNNYNLQMIKKQFLLLLVHNWSQVSHKCVWIFGMEFRIVLDEKNSDSSLGTSPPTDIDTDSEAKKKESGNIFDFLSRVWQLGGNSINHIHGGQRPPFPNWLNFLTYHTKGGCLMMCKIITIWCVPPLWAIRRNYWPVTISGKGVFIFLLN